MMITRYFRTATPRGVAALALLVLVAHSPVYAGPPAYPASVMNVAQGGGPGAKQNLEAGSGESLYFHVENDAQRLEMIVNTSRILTFDFNVPRLLVNNTQILKATPLAPNRVQIQASAPGVTQLNIWDENDQVRSIDVIIYGDARELQYILDTEFPDADIRVRPSNGSARGSVIISGFVSRPDHVTRIVQIAEDFYPNVINNMSVGGLQQVVLHVKVVEVSRTKLRQFGIDWALLTGNDFVIQSAAGLIAAAATSGGTLTAAGPNTLSVGVLNGTNTVGFLVDVLRQNNMAKLLAEPTLVTVSGRPASFNSGGEVPIPVNGGLGVTSVEYREFGTQIDFVPIVLGNGNIRLEVRPQITEIDESLRDATTGSPGFRSRRVDTGVEMRAGQTLALAGLIQNRVSSTDRGLPWLADLPWVGPMFGRVQETVNEVELLILVTPEFVTPLEANEVPPCGPGEATVPPNDTEFYFRRYREVPNCNCQDGSCQPGGPMGQAPLTEYPSGQPAGNQPPMQYPAPQQAPQQYHEVLPAPAPMAVGSNGRNGYPPVAVSNAPTANTMGNRQPSYNRSNARPDIRNAGLSGEPSLIGPIGYDVIK
ncbi:type II and III secretion system protein family protein [Lignipirellula cremea]|uniref:Type II secretion system protein D n=1 Tax=Lignipirellula cremea TaxID=2528010 RepID=A0A518E1J7_9BACT|nr:pilus assembly protein N-terminal domain-containing protein [Lignipirellula cremea]QDU97960.1 Putative type II secretion system protein D precursor [Lignipirellula cremea]